jgi:light-regulated signal transduction histidine kinase (bacteriophytochrome)
VEFTVHEGLVATGDKGLLYIVLNNLLSNAWKYTRNKAQPIIEFGNTDQDGKRVFYVRDNGVGFDMDFADNLFGVFQRMHSDAEYPGNGIGLATAQRVLKRHGGQIWAEAVKDQGATFYFSL